MIRINPKVEGNIIMCVENQLIQYNYMPELTVKLFLSIKGKTSHQKETENKRAIAIDCNLYPKNILKRKSPQNNTRIYEYFQPRVGRKNKNIQPGPEKQHSYKKKRA